MFKGTLKWDIEPVHTDGLLFENSVADVTIAGPLSEEEIFHFHAKTSAPEHEHYATGYNVFVFQLRWVVEISWNLLHRTSSLPTTRGDPYSVENNIMHHSRRPQDPRHHSELPREHQGSVTTCIFTLCVFSLANCCLRARVVLLALWKASLLACEKLFYFLMSPWGLSHETTHKPSYRDM